MERPNTAWPATGARHTCVRQSYSGGRCQSASTRNRCAPATGRAASAEPSTTLAGSSATFATTSQPANVGAVSTPMPNSRAAKSDLETGSASHAAASALLAETSASTATSLVMGSKHSSRSHPNCSGRATGSARNAATTITTAARDATAAVTVADDTARVYPETALPFVCKYT